MIEERREGPEGRRYELWCEVCGKRWTVCLAGWEDVRRYLKLREVCPAGWHEVEGGIGRVVWVRRL